mmetsp:Transcript_85648/g.164881  ORF Transcript_85648/g.164881 Transcript_85648/m.164881 type:complete len:595 (+) Transcript_85648:72-1856(+)
MGVCFGFSREGADLAPYVRFDICPMCPRTEQTGEKTGALQPDEKVGPLTLDNRAGGTAGKEASASDVACHGLQAPLLSAEAAAQQQMQRKQPKQRKQRPKRFGRWTCMHLLAPVPLWLFAALLGWVTASAICMVLRLHSVAALRPEKSFDFTLRLAVATNRCIGIGKGIGFDAGYEVALKPCTGSWDEQFLVKPDGTIRFKDNNDLCLTMSRKHIGKQMIMTNCADGSPHEKAFDVLPNGRIALHAQRDLCMNLLQGNLARGLLGMHECGKDFNEVFLYGGGHFLVPLLLREFHQVQKLDAELANTVGLGIWVLPSCVFAGIVAFALSRRLLKASGTSHGCCLQSIHGLALLCVAVAIFFQLSIVTCIGIVTWVAQQFLDGQNVTTAAVTPHVDYTLRFAQKIDFCIGAANGLHDNASVTLQHCHTGGLQQFSLQTDGTIRSKRRDDLCVTKVADSSQWQLQTCSTNSSDRQIFNAAAQSHGWLELQAMPDMCMSLLAKGALGVQACSRDVNEVFVYSGGNAGIAELALHLNDAVQALTKALQVSDGFPIVAMQPGARAQGAAWALLVAVPSILLLLGRLPAPKLDDEDLMLTL